MRSVFAIRRDTPVYSKVFYHHVCALTQCAQIISRKLSFGLSNSILASSNFTSSKKVSRATNRLDWSDFTWKGWGSFSFPWKIFCSRIRLANWLIGFSFVTGAGINFRPRDSKVICSSVSCSFDRFLIYCLRDSMALQKCFLSLIFLRSLNCNAIKITNFFRGVRRVLMF